MPSNITWDVFDCAEDCLERAECDKGGRPGHDFCGYCETHAQPKHHCGDCANPAVPFKLVLSDEPMPDWERELLTWTNEDFRDAAKKRYEASVTNLLALIQEHVDSKFSDPMKFRFNLNSQRAQVLHFEKNLAEAEETVKAFKE